MVRDTKAHVGADPALALRTLQDRLPPVRGLVLTRNLRGQPFKSADVKRWLRMNRVVFKTEKVDLLAGEETQALLAAYIDCAGDLDMRLSLRTNCESAPPDLRSLHAAGLLDLFLTPRRATHSGYQAWLDAGHNAGLKMRVQLNVPLHKSLDPETYAQRYRDAGVVVVNLAAYDALAHMECDLCNSVFDIVL